MQRCALDGTLWNELKRAYGYASATPGVRDFAIALFGACYAMGLGERSSLAPDAFVFLKRWKDSTRHHEAFETLSAECAAMLGIEQDLQGRDYRTLVELDIFELIDCKILSELVRDVANKTIAAVACEELIRQRREGHWYTSYAHPYEAVWAASQLLQSLGKVDLTVQSLADGVERYSRSWYRLDQLYRQFIIRSRRSGQNNLLNPLLELIENLYTNNYLVPLNNRWQEAVDACTSWDAAPVPNQQTFYADRVRPFLGKGNKVCVVISDALRYEIGEELLRLIRQEDRFEATLDATLSTLPSCTQLGMAALLPHRSLALTGEALGLVDGTSSQGTENRRKILEAVLPGKAAAVRAEDLLNLGKEESRALFRDNEVVYVYHNRIDATGDKPLTEDQVFEAVDEALDELVRIVKKLANANASNLLVTADHGFIYQHRRLEDSDFAGSEPLGSDITYRNRRFVLGHGLVETGGFKRFTAARGRPGRRRRDADPEVDQPAAGAGSGQPLRARRRRAAGSGHPGAADQQEAAERPLDGRGGHPARLDLGHHRRPGGGCALPDRAGDRKGPGQGAACGHLHPGRGADLRPARADRSTSLRRTRATASAASSSC